MMPDPDASPTTLGRAVVLVLLVALAAPLLAGCTGPPGDDGDGGDGDPAQHAQCVELRGDQPSDDRAVRNASNPVVVMETNCGTIRIELYADLTPITAGNFLNLTEDGFYNGTRFHRVIADFMIQDGDPNSKDEDQKDRWGFGGPGYTIPDEFPCADGNTSHEHPADCDELVLTHDGPGVLSMANSGDPHTGGSQYFITVTDTPHLDGRHSVFGQVVEGMQVVHAISKVDTAQRDRPVEDVLIHSVTLEGGD